MVVVLLTLLYDSRMEWEMGKIFKYEPRRSRLLEMIDLYLPLREPKLALLSLPKC